MGHRAKSSQTIYQNLKYQVSLEELEDGEIDIRVLKRDSLGPIPSRTYIKGNNFLSTKFPKRRAA